MKQNKNQKSNYIATAFCDGEKKFFTVKNVRCCDATRVAKGIGRSLFLADYVVVLKLEIDNVNICQK